MKKTNRISTFLVLTVLAFCANFSSGKAQSLLSFNNTSNNSAAPSLIENHDGTIYSTNLLDVFGLVLVKDDTSGIVYVYRPTSTADYHESERVVITIEKSESKIIIRDVVRK